MTVDEMLKLKDSGLTVEEITQLAPHVTTPSAASLSQPQANNDIIAQVNAGIAAMQETLKQMHEQKDQQLAVAIADVKKKMQYGNVNRPTGEEMPYVDTDTAAAAASYIASVINPGTKEAVPAEEGK